MEELIKKYILGELSTEEKTAFEEKLNNDPALQEEVKSQEEIIKGIERLALKKSAGLAYKKFKLLKSLKLFTGAFIGVTILAVGLWFFDGSDELPNHINHEVNEKGETLWSDADRLIPTQTFTIDPNQDTVIETEGGMILAIPAGSWSDENGNTPEGPIDVEVKEALDPATMMSGGLSTTSSEGPLETGGMFSIDGRKGGEPLQITGDGISASIPTNDFKPDMQLFDGVRNEKGGINWVAPMKIESFLQPVDILTLDFYPPLYLDSLEAMGLNAGNKKYTDSLYYSFYLSSYHSEEVIPEAGDSDGEGIGEGEGSYHTVDLILREEPSENDLLYVQDPITEDQLFSDSIDPGVCDKGIPPSRIKAIWNRKFNGTLLATKEFEQRLKVIHESCDLYLLELYIKNLDKRMSYVDSLAMKHSAEPAKSQFAAFAKLGLGRVKDADKKSKMLTKYFRKRSEAYEKAARQTAEKFQEKNRKLTEKYNRKKDEFEQSEFQREQNNLQDEIDLNYCDACEQLGYRNACKGSNQPSTYYTVTVVNPGWKNIDKFLMDAIVESTTNRETLDFRDTSTGKRAVIEYKPVSFRLNNEEAFDKVFAYLLPTELNSFMRMDKNEDGVYFEKLNELIEYDFAAIAYKGNETYYIQLKSIQPQEYTDLNFTKISQAELKNKFNHVWSKGVIKSLRKDIKVQRYFIKEEKRQKEYTEIMKLRERLKPIVFPCRCACSSDGGEHGTSRLSSIPTDEATIAAGKDLYSSKCSSCHFADLDKPNRAYPELANVLDRVPGVTEEERINWLRQFIPDAAGMIARDNYAKELLRKYNGVVMTSFGDLTPTQVDQLIAYIAEESIVPCVNGSKPCSCDIEVPEEGEPEEEVEEETEDDFDEEE